nr:retrovirus-related Pol polyprotein from transposon TNT 1-94 [Tanacetum cinerariifolium]
MGKSTKKTHKPKSEDTNQEKLYLLHMDLYGPIRVESINGNKYILVIVDDYSRFTWVKFLRSKDDTPMFIIKFLKMIQQNGVIERCNRTLIEAARTMLIYAQAPLFLWAEAVATACFRQNRSIIRLRHGKTPYEHLHSKQSDLSFFHVFGALCYPTNDSENVGCPNHPLIMGYGDYQIVNVTISWVYYVEGLGHNLFSLGQFCDSDLEVAFRQHTCFISNLEGVDLLTGSRGNNLYTLSLQDMMASSPICLLSKASKTKSWLWHRRLSHLNFGAINHPARQGLVRGLPKLKFEKDHLCSACAMGKSTKKTHKPKSKDTNQEKLYLLHMDLCVPMRVESVNGKKYILVIVDDYSRFTWVWLNVPVRHIRTDNGTEFVNQTLRDYYEEVGISHKTSVARSPQQNRVVKRRNRTLIEVARTMLIYAQAPLFLWAEAVATTCFTQNRSIIRLRHKKTPYELLHSKVSDLLFFHVFGALCYPTNDSENLGKLQPNADIGIFIGYAQTKKSFRIYNRCTRRIVETIHVDFDELTAMASE